MPDFEPQQKKAAPAVPATSMLPKDEPAGLLTNLSALSEADQKTVRENYAIVKKIQSLDPVETPALLKDIHKRHENEILVVVLKNLKSEQGIESGIGDVATSSGRFRAITIDFNVASDIPNFTKHLTHQLMHLHSNGPATRFDIPPLPERSFERNAGLKLVQIGGLLIGSKSDQEKSWGRQIFQLGEAEYKNSMR